MPQVLDQANHKARETGTVSIAAAHVVSANHDIVVVIVLVVVEMVLQDAIIAHRSIQGVFEIVATIHHRIAVIVVTVTVTVAVAVATAAVKEGGDSKPPVDAPRKASEFLPLCPSGRFRILVDCLGVLWKSVAKLLLMLMLITIMLLVLLVKSQRRILVSRQSVAAAASASNINDGESLIVITDVVFLFYNKTDV